MQTRTPNRLPSLALVGAAVLFVGLAVAGVPLGSLFVLGVILMCPLLMVGMHMGAGNATHAGGNAAPSRLNDPSQPARPDLRSDDPIEDHEEGATR